jgi:alpha-mannosidase
MITSDNNSLAEQCSQLRKLSQQPIDHWKRNDAAPTDSPTDSLTGSFEHWPPAELDSKQNISWPAGEVRWLAIHIVVPTDLHGYPLAGHSLRLSLVWWSIDTQIYVNGQLVQAGDLFDARARVLLSPSVQAGDTWDVRIRLVSPGHDRGALMQSIAIYESPDALNPEPGFVADEIAVGTAYGLTGAAEILETLDWELLKINVAQFNQQLQSIRQQLAARFDKKAAQISLLGHAHLDMAWLWEVSETWEVADRTFNSVLSLQSEFPELTFCHTSPALYAWIEEHRPALFARIQTQVASGRWEVVGGMWVEPDLNLISGESIARQIIYGQRYVNAKFGQVSKVAWLPDTFGFCQQLPQFLKLGQIDYFVTQKFLWNDTNQFPHQIFWWQSPDGSKVLSYMSAPIGEGIEPVKIAEYGRKWQEGTGDNNALWLCGVGDHGGGPTRDMLLVQQRWQSSPLCPAWNFTTVENYLAPRATEDLPVWADELYLEFHRGCYTTHAEQKRSNRQAEDALYQAELWTTIEGILTGHCKTHPEIERAWKLALFNQFHDILPGSAIQPVYVTANQEWQEAANITDYLISLATMEIACHVDTSAPPHPEALPLIVFNSLNWTRSSIVEWPIHSAKEFYQLWDCQGNVLPTDDLVGSSIGLASDIPGVGYRLFWLVPVASVPEPVLPNHWCLENPYLKVAIDPQTGDIQSLFDKQRQLEILASSGNQLLAYTDAGQYWDAWNIDPNYAQHPLPIAELLSITWLHDGLVEQRLQVRRRIGKSIFTQVYLLGTESRRLDIETTVDWQEEHVLVKAYFPLVCNAETVTCEVPCGVIVRKAFPSENRPTVPTTPAEKAKWEIPAYRWVDLTDQDLNYGVSLLNDCKHGYSYTANSLSLSLLRASTWPDPVADRQIHKFTYAVYPHPGNWQKAQTVHQGCELNSPVQSVEVDRSVTGTLASSQSFVSLGSNSLVLMALYPAETDDRLVLRCYESSGRMADVQWTGGLQISADRSIDLLETSLQYTEENQKVLPWQVKSWLVNYQNPNLQNT